jgi:OmpA family
MLDASWEANVGCQVYRVELDRHRKASEDEQRVTKDLLANLLLMFGDTTQPHVRDLLLEICEEMDEMFPFPRRREDAVSEDMVHWEVKYNLDMAVWFGELTIRKLDDPWWERLPPPELTKPPPRDRIRVIPPRREPVEPPEKTWFAAQFVDESGLWIDGLAVKMKINGVAQSLTTDKAGVVKVTEQTASISIVSVADIAQAERILVDRLDKLDEAGAPTGKDVVGYPLDEPAKTVILQPATPRMIVLGLRRTWFEARVIDEVGVPVPGLDLAFSVNGESTLTTDGAGVARLEAFGNPSATVMIASVGQAQSILDPRWKQVREAKIPGGSDVSVLQLAEVMGAIPLIEMRRHTIVLTPERTWIEIRVVDDNNNPISGRRARLHLTDGRVVEKILGDDGLIRVDETVAGVCKLVLPVRDLTEWIDPSAPAPAQDPRDIPDGHWIVRRDIKPPGPEVEGLETGESHVVVVGRKIVEQFEIDDALFRLMSAVLLPEGQSPGADPTEPDGTRPTTIDLLAASLRYAELHPNRKILISGHTDTSGGDEYNQNLSEFRAAAVYAVLANDSGSREEFGDLCHGPHLQGKEKKQQVLYDDRVQVLNWVADTFGWPCSTSSEYGSYLRAVKEFQRTYDTEGNERNPIEQLDVDGDFGPASWRAVFDCYQVQLAKTLEVTAQELQELQTRVRPRFLKPFVGCGESKPKEMAGVDNYRSQTNRRVEVMFFEPDDHVPETPCLSGDCDPGACELYDRTWYGRKWLVGTPRSQMALIVGFPDDLFAHLPDGLRLRLSGVGIPTQEVSIETAWHVEGTARITFDLAQQDEPCTLEAVLKERALFLWRDQVLGPNAQPQKWEAQIWDILDQRELEGGA